jgi:tRNA 5-methylaminomethyl-2-thiouridine biosynthesis bifunctional protein
MPGRSEPPSPIVTWDDDGAPRSPRFGDIYFSKDGGLAETRAVFLQGCGLPQAWAGRSRFTVAELGLGTGLNIAAVLELWRRTRPAGALLNLFSVEAHPLTAADARRALALWSELDDIAGLLTERWPGRAMGLHRVDLPELGATLDVAILPAHEALAQWAGRADAWFLDGFAPDRNPDMWTDELLALVARRSAPGARLATYTVAGGVRRALAAAGFAVEKAPGFGRKRERLEGRLPGLAADPPAPPEVAIIGAGVAGAALARAYRDQGIAVRVFEPLSAGGGASGNPAALVTPRLDAGLGAEAALFAHAFRRATQLYDGLPQIIIDRGALQLEVTDRDAGRFNTIAASDLFEPGAISRLTADEISVAFGETAPPGLLIADAAVIEPAALLAAWLPATEWVAVARLEAGADGWRLLDADGRTLMTAQVVCLAAGVACADLASGLPLSAVRGQANFVRGVAAPATAAFGGYVIPTRDGLLFGATHDRDDTGCEVRAADTARNLETLAATAPNLAARLEGRILAARAAPRATTQDYLPLAGAVPGAEGLFVLSGLGSRGFTLAPLLAEHVAALSLGAPSPLPTASARLTAPSRFAERLARRGRFTPRLPTV